jgi:hypothetical protein
MSFSEYPRVEPEDQAVCEPETIGANEEGQEALEEEPGQVVSRKQNGC